MANESKKNCGDLARFLAQQKKLLGLNEITDS